MTNEHELQGHKGFVTASKYREIIFAELNISARTPKDLTNLTAISQPNVSRTLMELRRDGLIECLNPRSIKTRYYNTTELGKQVFNILKNEPGIDKLLGKRLEERIEEALSKNGIGHIKSHKLETRLFDFIADFFIPGKNTVIITKFPKVDADIVYKIAYECAKLKKTYEGISIILFLHRNADQNWKFKEGLEKLKDDGDYSILYESDEGSLGRLIDGLK